MSSDVSRRGFLTGVGMTAGALALPGCLCAPPLRAKTKVALHLYSIRTYIRGKKGRGGRIETPGVGLARALRALSAIGYKGVEFSGYYGYDAKTLKAMLDAAGLVACGTHVTKEEFGPKKLASTCEFNLCYGNNLIICPGGGNLPDGASWGAGQGGSVFILNELQEDAVKKLCDHYNRAAADAAKYGCRIGLHNHTWEFGTRFRDGTTFWDYFFAHTDPAVCMQQNVGWTTCAGADPCEQYKKYPHRSPTLHAKENGLGPGVRTFDAVLGQPGRPGAMPVDWDALVHATQRDGVAWYVVECERHDDDLSAVLPSYEFLRARGLV